MINVPLVLVVWCSFVAVLCSCCGVDDVGVVFVSIGGVDDVDDGVVDVDRWC